MQTVCANSAVSDMMPPQLVAILDQVIVLSVCSNTVVIIYKYPFYLKSSVLSRSDVACIRGLNL